MSAKPVPISLKELLERLRRKNDEPYLQECIEQTMLLIKRFSDYEYEVLNRAYNVNDSGRSYEAAKVRMKKMREEIAAAEAKSLIHLFTFN